LSLRLKAKRSAYSLLPERWPPVISMIFFIDDANLAFFYYKTPILLKKYTYFCTFCRFFLEHIDIFTYFAAEFKLLMIEKEFFLFINLLS
jgi:hypothetical protein